MKSDAPGAVVLKFGSSVLRTSDTLPVAVAEVYRHYRNGECVIAVVSAFEGLTDSLSATAWSFSDDPEPAALAALLSTGEIASAAQLTLSLHRAGIPAELLDPRDVDLTAEGDRTDAALARLSLEKVRAGFSRRRVLVLPGFFAAHAEGGLALLGRGGSDLTALFLASELRCRCLLLKDVDGLYESDPTEASTGSAARETKTPRRFALADYATAEERAGPLLQAKALRFARDRALSMDVSRVGGLLHTRIGQVPAVLGPPPLGRRIRVALLGLGTVGGGVLEYLGQFPERYEVVAALVRSPEKHVSLTFPKSLFVRSSDEVFARRPEILVEALPELEPARSCVGRALERNIRVVTANKALIAAEWSYLARFLAGPRRQLRYAATIGGSVPMIETIERLALRSRITQLRGVLNGTSNFILDRLAAGDALSTAIRSAQIEGFAESNPTEDLSGRDTERKLRILGSLAFGGSASCEALDGIESKAPSGPADAHGQTRVRLVAEAERAEGGYTYQVGPKALPLRDYLANTRGAENRLEITTADGALHRLSGLGAGRVPTATAAFADVLEHARVIEEEELAAEHSEAATG